MTELPTEIRVGLTLERELAQRLDRVCPWGIKSAVLRKAVTLIVEAAEARGTVALALLLDDQLELKPKEGTYAPRRSGKERRTDEHGGAASPGQGYTQGQAGEQEAAADGIDQDESQEG